MCLVALPDDSQAQVDDKLLGPTDSQVGVDECDSLLRPGVVAWWIEKHRRILINEL